MDGDRGDVGVALKALDLGWAGEWVLPLFEVSGSLKDGECTFVNQGMWMGVSVWARTSCLALRLSRSLDHPVRILT